MEHFRRRNSFMEQISPWSVTTRSFCTLYGQVGLKGYAEITCKITFSKNSQKIGVQNNIVETLQFVSDAVIDMRAKAAARAILAEVVRIPADYVDQPADAGGDPSCGLSNHEGPRLEYMRQAILDHGSVAGADDEIGRAHV